MHQSARVDMITNMADKRKIWEVMKSWNILPYVSAQMIQTMAFTQIMVGDRCITTFCHLILGMCMKTVTLRLVVKNSSCLPLHSFSQQILHIYQYLMQSK